MRPSLSDESELRLLQFRSSVGTVTAIEIRRLRDKAHFNPLSSARGFDMRIRFLTRNQEGKVGWILLWLLGIPIPVLLILFLVRGCT